MQIYVCLIFIFFLSSRTLYHIVIYMCVYVYLVVRRHLYNVALL